MADERDSQKLSFYRACRIIKKSSNSLYNALRSIYEDSVFVSEIAGLWPELPLVANLRCGLWYSSRFDSTCYFKSTDGHNNNWSFNTSRLNLHVASLAGQRGGCIIVDSTRKGKRFPDSMSKTIPIWACVLNRAIANYRRRMGGDGQQDDRLGANSLEMLDWDISLHLPLWVLKTEAASIEYRLEEWTKNLEASGADIASLASFLKKPLRPLWISQRTVIWLNEVPDHDSWSFTPLILVSASHSDGNVQKRLTTSEFSWHYIPGAGDDEESWARGLSPALFWKNFVDLIHLGPDLCNKRVAEIVEQDRIYRARRGEEAPQVKLKPLKPCERNINVAVQELNDFECMVQPEIMRSSNEEHSIFWVGSTNIAVGSTLHVSNISRDVDCILNCGTESVSTSSELGDSYLHLPVASSKMNRFSLLNNLPSALAFAKLNLSRGKTLLLCCCSGEDISVCVSLAIMTSLYDEKGTFDGGESLRNTSISKLEMRKRLVFVCKYVINARPSRGNIKQVYSFLSGGKERPLVS